MSKGDGSARANLRATRAQINNASASAQTRAFKARQVAKQRRDSEERKLRAALAAANDAKAKAKAATTPPTTTSEVSAERAGEEAKPSDLSPLREATQQRPEPAVEAPVGPLPD